jgi:twitching motility protein PilT
MFDVKLALRELVEKHGSDLHLKAGAAPLFRVNGALSHNEGAGQLAAEDTEDALRQLLSDETKLEEFAREHEVDFSFEIDGVARFRINAFRQRGLASMVCRAIPHKISTIEELALPPVVTELAEEERGIVLLTGTTGSVGDQPARGRHGHGVLQARAAQGSASGPRRDPDRRDAR